MTPELPPLSDDEIRLLPLGGLGEIGLNMMAIEHRGSLLVIDCGLMFPESYMLGIDLVIPDISVLRQSQLPVRALLLTHGHEDHIGAIPFLIEQLGFPPIYGTPLTLGLLRGKLEEFGLEDRVELQQVTLREEIDLEPFRVEFFRAAHSIVDGAGLAIRTNAGTIVHTGDFKLDPSPVDDEKTDTDRLEQLGDEGVLLLLSDSTNVENEGHTRSEREVGESFAEIIPQCRGQVVISTFSSNIHRIQQVVDAAKAFNRKILVNGRSMIANIAIARRLGYLKIPDDLLIDLRDYRDLPRHRLLVLTTGSQGEPLSALTRIATDEHKQISLQPGDTVILSSKLIPGNEKAITGMINHIYRRGAEVHYEATSEIHVSGHAAREELRSVLKLTRPQWFVPVHGEYRHLVKHAELAQVTGVETENAVVLENGTALILSAPDKATTESFESGRIFVDGKGVGDVGFMELRDRSHLAHHGMVVILLAVNRSNGAIVFGPELLTRGFLIEEEHSDFLDQARQVVANLLEEQQPQLLTDHDELQVELRKGLRRFFNKTIERRPMILPVVLEL
ncbi:MAG: ribonuclease J [Desulfuromonas sp.]|nr:MAG: ribonuclease J [Desulfuromonas sp.]